MILKILLRELSKGRFLLVGDDDAYEILAGLVANVEKFIDGRDQVGAGVGDDRASAVHVRYEI